MHMLEVRILAVAEYHNHRVDIELRYPNLLSKRRPDNHNIPLGLLWQGR